MDTANRPVGDTLRFSTSIWPRPIEFAHRSGRLVIETDRVTLDLSVAEVVKTPEQSDRLRLRRSIAVREPLVFEATDQRGEPNEGVYVA